MFTGLVKELGTVLQVTPNQEGKELTVGSSDLIQHIGVDDSVSINGACQTVTSFDAKSFKFQSVHVTLEKTSLGSLKPGDKVNMELAVRPMDFMGGHIVQGHVNSLAKCVDVKATGKNYECRFEIDENSMKYIVQEGSITLNGVSLTVARVSRENNQFGVSIIPHTWDATTFAQLKIGTMVNVEVDILAKYVENLIYYRDKHKNNSKLTPEWLASKGF